MRGFPDGATPRRLIKRVRRNPGAGQWGGGVLLETTGLSSLDASVASCSKQIRNRLPCFPWPLPTRSLAGPGRLPQT